MKQWTVLIICCNLILTAAAQGFTPAGGGEYSVLPHDEMSPAKYAEIFRNIEENEVYLKAQGLLNENYNKTAAVEFQFPLEWNDGFEGYNFYAISNYVDHNPAYPDVLTDYNCGSRTYDTDAGYNHQGIDYFLWPFDWNLTNAGAVKIVAAAPGMIVGKYDGNFDENCAFNPGSWNAVYLRHDDGSTTWYGHMKSGSLTTKNLGDMIEAGEYLGTVGSSGNSTGPHLHFEVYDADDNLIDPFAGTCNDLNAESWWTAQDDYIVPQINRLQTHVSPPNFLPCPEPAITYESNTFNPGDICYFVLYAKDLSATDLCNLKITKADGSVWYDWEFYQPADYYVASYWYWYYTIDNDAPEGEWIWSAELDGEYYEHRFVVGQLPIDIHSTSSITSATGFYQNDMFQINVMSDKTMPVQVTILNAFGQSVNSFSTQVAEGKNVIPVAANALAAGIYYIQIIDEHTNTDTAISILKHE
jgi:murein DD-endopeptidase MepM/ murein hydrolase activator NlpD